MDFLVSLHWMKSSTTLIFYITLIAFTSAVLYVLGVTDMSVNMSVVNTLHAFLSFYFLHWVKGGWCLATEGWGLRVQGCSFPDLRSRTMPAALWYATSTD